MGKRSPSLLLAGLAAVVWATSAAVCKLGLRSCTGFQLLLFVSGCGTLSLLGLVLITGRAHLLLEYRGRALLSAARLGFLGIFLNSALYYYAFSRAPAQQVNLVTYTWPLWTVLFVQYLAHRARPTLGRGAGRTHRAWWRAAPLVVTFAGVALALLGGGAGSPGNGFLVGDALALGGAIAYGLFSARIATRRDDRLVAATLYFGFATLFALLWLVVTRSMPALPSPAEWAGLIWLGAVVGAGGLFFWFSALRRGDPVLLSNLVLITPLLALLFIWILLGEAIRLTSILGCLLIVGGILVQARISRPRRPAPALAVVALAPSGLGAEVPETLA
jgi:drug/metabolite transporter (DMT)-like permease